MKKSFSYNLTQFGATENTSTEQIKTSDGVKTITTDASTGAVILADSVDADSLNPVTGAAVATAVAQASGEVPEYGESDANKVLKVDAQGEELVWGTAGGAYTAGNGIDITGDEISVAIGSGGIQIDTSDNTLMIGDADYHMVYVDDGAIKVRHDSTISETVDNDNYGQLGVANPVPTPGANDANKVLTVSDALGNYGWADAPTELPSVTGNAGKVLTVNSGATGVEWASAGGGGGDTINYRGYNNSNAIWGATSGLSINLRNTADTDYIPAGLYLVRFVSGNTASAAVATENKIYKIKMIDDSNQTLLESASAVCNYFTYGSDTTANFHSTLIWNRSNTNVQTVRFTIEDDTGTEVLLKHTSPGLVTCSIQFYLLGTAVVGL